MVSRTTPARTSGGSPRRLSHATFGVWRRFLGLLGARLRAVADWPRLACVAGPVLAVLGTTVGLTAGTLGDETLLGTAVFAAETCAWAAYRLVVLALKGPGSPRRLAAMAPAWAVGLSPYLLGVTPTLRGAAFLASAIVTYRSMLSSSDVDAGAARRAIAWSFGGQAAILTLAWVYSNGLFFLPLATR